MANVWGTNPIILDTAANDTSYDVAEDAYKTATGDEYSTGSFNIQAIKVTGANTNQVTLQTCTPDASVDNGAVFYDHVLETGRLYNFEAFSRDFMVQGIFPKTITAGAKVYIYV